MLAPPQKLEKFTSTLQVSKPLNCTLATAVDQVDQVQTAVVPDLLLRAVSI